jgi:hypothetical protein
MIRKRFYDLLKESFREFRFELAGRACDLVNERWRQIQAVAQALLERKTL